MPALSRFNYDAMPIAKTEVTETVHCHTAADTLLYAVTVTSDPVSLTFDLQHLQHIACDVMKNCTKLESNRTIRGGVIVISVFDLMTLNIF